MATNPCRQAKIEQVSTGEAGPHINRDLEILFAAVNQLIRCVAKVSVFLDGGSGGAFSSGSVWNGIGGTGGTGGTGTGGSGGGSTDPPNPLMKLESGSNVILPDYFEGVVYIDPTAAINVTLGTPSYQGSVTIVHGSTAAHDLTIKNPNGDTIATISQYQYAVIPAMVASDGSPAWPTVAIVMGSSGEIYSGDVVVDNDLKGFIWTDSSGHLWRGTINTSGALVTADLGTTKPAPEEPIL